MNPVDLAAEGIEEIEVWLDRLVDGEVPDDQRWELLCRLEQTPDGWRRCALAFLEAQAWTEECGTLVGRTHAQPADSSETTSPATSKPHWRTRIAVLSAVASFFAAFGLGVVIQRTWLGDDPPIAASPIGKFDARTANGHTRGEQPGQWGTVQFVADRPGGTSQEYQLPAIDGPDPDRWLTQQPPVIPPNILQQLQRAGHHVETQRHYVPVPLQDGRRALFPVENVEVRFRGGHGYQ